MADTLGALHRVDPKEAGLEGFGKPDAYSRRQVERWARQYRESVVTPEPFMTELIEWLRAHVPPSEPSGRIVHGDFRLDNLVFANANGPLGDASGGNAPRDARRAETGVVAVLDWELATVGAPYSDVAYCCMPYHLPSVDAANPGMASTAYPAFGASIPDGVPSEKAFVRRWARAAGLPNPTEGASAATRWPFYVAMSLFRGAAILAGVRARAAAGNASAANAHAAGTLVETLATRALSVAGCVPGGVPRAVASSSGTTASAPPRPAPPASSRRRAARARLRRFMAEHACPRRRRWRRTPPRTRGGASRPRRAPQGAGKARGAVEPVAPRGLARAAQDQRAGGRRARSCRAPA